MTTNVEDPNAWWKKYDTGFHIDTSSQYQNTIITKSKEEQEKDAIQKKFQEQDDRIKELERQVKTMKKKMIAMRLASLKKTT